MPAHRSYKKRILAGVTLCGLIGAPLAGMWAQDAPPPVKLSPAFEPPPIQPTLIDFLTGMPVSYNMKVASTTKLLRPPFASKPLDTPKGLAAQIKFIQCDAKNRCKAVKFLGCVDCVKFPESQDVLMGALKDDPIECVRYEAALAFQQQLKAGRTRHISRTAAKRYDTCPGCCNPKVMAGLSEVAYGTDERGCYKEPSERVREAAACALSLCCDAHGGVEYASGVAVPEGAPATGVPQPMPGEPQAAPPATGAIKNSGDAPAELPQQVSGDENGESQATTANIEITPAVTPAPTEEQQAALAAQLEQCPEVQSLRGYCPVALTEHRLIKAEKQFGSIHQGWAYYFSSQAAKEKFDAAPQDFAPAWNGLDPIELNKFGRKVPGRYRYDSNGRMYFFTSKDNMDQFVASPESFQEAR